jgi:membrane fusion protein (multidrug efflux system)
MIILMTVGYLVCVILAFKVIKIEVSHPRIAVTALIFVMMQVGTVVVWKMAAPTTKQMVLRRHVLQIIPDVREVVSKVHVQSNQLVKKGQPLFDITPDRFQNAVDQSTADLAAAKSTVSQLESAVAVTVAALKESKANTAAAKSELKTAQNLKNENPGAIAGIKLEEKRQALLAAEADDKLAEATLKESQFSLEAAKHAVDVAQSSLKTANFNRERCTYRSPVDGRVMNMQMSEGTTVARYHFTSTGTVEDLSDTAILAIFPQNQLTNVKAGNKVEIAFKRTPGEVVTGKVELVVNYTGEGQLIPSSKLPDAASIGSKGRLAVRINLDDEELARKLPLGAAGTVAIYTDFGKPFHVISKINVRISAWMNYLPI